MKETGIRVLSGLAYILLLIGGLYNQYTVTLLFFCFGILCLSEFKILIKSKNYLPYIVFFLLYFGSNYYYLKGHDENIKTTLFVFLLLPTLVVQFLLVKSLLSHKDTFFTKTKPLLFTTFYSTTPFVFLAFIPYYNNGFTPYLLLGLFILVWVNDTFAYLIGKTLGKHKLFPSVSPKKTIEGFLGGVVFTCITGCIIAYFFKVLSGLEWIVLAVITSIVGTIGDLIESKFKRLANVKDSGTIMPGHGGLLDRLDSVIFVAPIIILVLNIFKYVS